MTQTISVAEEDRYAQLQLMALDYAREGKTNELQAMIKHGMSVNLLTHKDDSLLMLASYNGHIKTAKMLLEYGANIDKVNQRGQTPLEGVCFKGNLEMVQLLLDHGASPEGNAVTYAIIFGNRDVLELLKRHGVDSKNFTLLGLNIEWIVALTTKVRKFFKRG
ncbi:MAG TPA: ankyrin repeat domain-containing protein [bacterium (Candidatus Stahlbacteria)]|nr:ankyrin repeat domain-containing protein [Candidatus Stahlbacteria bacterium]